jgi:hypothetical protein
MSRPLDRLDIRAVMVDEIFSYTITRRRDRGLSLSHCMPFRALLRRDSHCPQQQEGNVMFYGAGGLILLIIVIMLLTGRM